MTFQLLSLLPASSTCWDNRPGPSYMARIWGLLKKHSLVVPFLTKGKRGKKKKLSSNIVNWDLEEPFWSLSFYFIFGFMSSRIWFYSQTQFSSHSIGCAGLKLTVTRLTQTAMCRNQAVVVWLRNDHHRLQYLNTWWSAGDTVWKGGASLLGKYVTGRLCALTVHPLPVCSLCILWQLRVWSGFVPVFPLLNGLWSLWNISLNGVYTLQVAWVMCYIHYNSNWKVTNAELRPAFLSPSLLSISLSVCLLFSLSPTPGILCFV